MAEKPDIIVLATGGRSPHRPGADVGRQEGLAVSTWDMLSGKVEPAENVLVYDGISTHAGSGAADFLASRGAKVEIVTPDVKVADDVGGTTFPIFYRRLYSQGVILTPNYWLDRVYARRQQADRRPPQRVHRGAGRARGRSGRDRERQHAQRRTLLEAEGAVAQPRPDRPPHALRGRARSPRLRRRLGNGRFLLFRVGDCVSMHNIHAAIYDALRLCKDF